MFLDVDGCFSNPCFGEATCVPLKNATNTDYLCECPDDVTGRNCDEATVRGVTYKVFLELTTWEEAQNVCEENGLILTSIYDAESYAFISTYTRYYPAAAF